MPPLTKTMETLLSVMWTEESHIVGQHARDVLIAAFWHLFNTDGEHSLPGGDGYAMCTLLVAAGEIETAEIAYLKKAWEPT